MDTKQPRFLWVIAMSIGLMLVVGVNVRAIKHDQLLIRQQDAIAKDREFCKRMKITPAECERGREAIY